MDLYTYTQKNIPEGWEELFKIAASEIKHVSEILEEEKKKGYRIAPDQENIFKIFHLCKPQDLTVVIVGQDPYHQIVGDNKCRALGYSFSVAKEDIITSSLHNIYKEIVNCYPDSIVPTHGDISHWVKQGVFLLNMCLTCRVNEPNSHNSKFRIWAPFINKFVKYMATVNKKLIWVLWGKEAQKMEEMIDKSFVNILMSNHPSGLSASRGFFGCSHFKLINDKLSTDNRPLIKWLDQDCKMKVHINKIVENMSSTDVYFLVDYYQKENTLEMEKNKFAVNRYVENLYGNTYPQTKLTMKEFYDLYLNLFSKYKTLKDTDNALRNLYSENIITKSLYKIMAKISEDDLQKIVETYNIYYTPDEEWCLPDFCLFGVVRKNIAFERFEEGIINFQQNQPNVNFIEYADTFTFI